MIIRVAMTSVYSVMAVWMPVIDVPRSAATDAIDTFITVPSSVIRNWLAARTPSTTLDPGRCPSVTTAIMPARNAAHRRLTHPG